MKTKGFVHAVVQVAVCVVGFAVVQSSLSAQTLQSWSAEPVATGNPHASPKKVTLENTVCFSMMNLVDNDTQTIISASGKSCVSTSSLFPDTLGGAWMISQPGKFSIKYGTEVFDDAVAWTWSSGGTGSTGAVVDFGGSFEFNDGRPDTDVRHDDPRILGGDGSKIFIPDYVCVVGHDCLGYPPPAHTGTQFTMKVSNQTDTTFGFSPLGIGEKILAIFCQYPDATLIKKLKDGANGAWAVKADNTFDDQHNAGANMNNLVNLGNAIVTLCQTYTITGGGWLDKNPTHSIGQGGSNVLHIVSYVRERVSPPFWRVTEDGVTCVHQP